MNTRHFTLLSGLAAVAMASSARVAPSGAMPRYSIKTARYEIYADDSTLLLDAQRNVENASRIFREHFDAQPSPLAVVYFSGTSVTVDLSDFARRGFLALPMIAPTGTISVDKPTGGEGTLAHEACHQFLIGYVDSRLGAQALSTRLGPSMYGHPAIPDWFDEAIATLCEEPPQVADREKFLKQQVAGRIPLDQLLSMNHPLADRQQLTTGVATVPSGISAGSGQLKLTNANGQDVTLDSATAERIRRAMAGDTTAGVQIQMSTMVGPAGPPRKIGTARVEQLAASPETDRALLFYAESQSIARFISARAGARSIQTIADALAAGKSTVEALSAISGIPHDAGQLEKEWLSWVQGPADALRQLPPQATVAFVDVSVIPMDRERVLDHQTVLVADGRITAMGPTATTGVPATAQRIDGRGKFLMPGLTDMHAHFAPGAGTIADPAGQQIALFLSAGFTTTRGLGGAVQGALSLRDQIKAGSLLGPRFVVASPSVNGQTAHSLAEVVARVDDAKRAGYDLVKTHGMFPSGEYYDSLVAVTQRDHLPLVGHVTPEYGLDRAMAAHQQVEHLDGYIASVLEDNVPKPGGQLIADANLLAHVDSRKIDAIVRKTVRLGIWNGPTLALFETIASDETPEQLAARPEMRFATPGMVQQFSQQKAGTLQIPSEGRHKFVEVRRQLVRALHDAGGKLLVGSDSPQFFMLPGYAALREIEAFVGAGLSPYAALEAATRNPAEFLGWSDAGTVAVGNRADLALLAANPMQSIANVRKLDGVMVNGRWLDSIRLAALRESVAAATSGR